MKTWHFAVVGLLLSATAGCRTDPNVAILERELRRKEDEIYRLRWALEDLQDASSCNDDWRPKNAEPDSQSPRRDEHAPPRTVAPPAIELPGTPTKKVPDALTPPAGSLPPDVPETPEHLRGPAGPALQRADSPRPPSIEGGVTAVVPLLGEPIRPSGDSRRVQSITLERMMTGGIGGGPDGDQGLLAVVEPRDAQGRTVDAPAEITVVALDPAITDAEGKAVAVARWEYTAAETAELFRRSDSAEAIHLMMGWPDQPPKHKNLHLFVRYATADGRRLQADMPVEIALPGERSNRWTPAELDRPEQRIPILEARRIEPQPREEARPAPRRPPRDSEPKLKRPVWSPDRPR